MRPIKLILLLTCVGLTAPLLSQARDKGLERPPADEKRVALVIGNQDYKGIPLNNPIHDARSMQSALEKLGFEVIYRENATRSEMDAVTRQFFAKLGGENTVGLFYYSGHGAQTDEGYNYLIPVGESITNSSELRYRAYNASIIPDRMEKTGNPVNIILLDACRQNTYKGRAESDGLASMSGGAGTFIAFATAPNKTADDGKKGAHSPFTQHLLQHISEPGLKIEDLMKQVRQEVSQDTYGYQLPWEASSFIGNFCFAGCDTAAASNQPSQAELAELQLKLEKATQHIQQLESEKAQLATPSATDEPLKPPPRPTATADFAIAMVPLKGGTFWMGSNEGEADEKPRHQVTVKPFKLGRYEVTRGQFAAFVKDTAYQATGGCFSWDGHAWKMDAKLSWRNPGFPQSDEHPVACVNWDDVNAYIAWLNRNSGQQYRLPTEAEWEYAARAGTDTVRFWGDGDAPACQYANVADQTMKEALNLEPYFHCQDGYVYTAPVGSFQANPWGLNDMLGNVWELTCSGYTESYDSSENQCNNNATDRRAVRGGSWYNSPRYLRAAFRYRLDPTLRFNYIGFRLAQD